MEPRRPKHVPQYADRCLDALVAGGLGGKISLGGAFGLLHYHDYRETRDVHAWWHESSSPADRARVRELLEEAMLEVGEVRVRTWGEVVSIELLREESKVFSFQIAERSACLEDPRPAPWIDILLDSFADLVASKMVAMVERGAPRDFRDIHALCEAGLTAPGECWGLWARRQEKAGASRDPNRARLAVQAHLARIETQRPFQEISASGERAAAERFRGWYKKEMLDGLMD